MNKNIKKVIFFTLLLVVTIGIVSAANNTDTTPEHKITKNIQEDSTTSTITNDYANSVKTMTKNTNATNKKSASQTYTATANNYNELVNRINQAKNTNYDSYTINLKKGTYKATSTIRLNKASGTHKIIINGNHATIKGQVETPFIIMNKKYTVTLNDIIITGFDSTIQDNGGAEGAITSEGKLIINNCQFTKNTGYLRASSVESHGALTISNTKFSNNCNIYPAMGTIYAEGKTIINNCQFINNEDAIISQGTLNVNSTKFLNNSGSIDTKGTAKINNCIFTNNNRYHGGAIESNYKLTISNSIFTNNKAEYGGAIYLDHATSTITNTVFTKNTAGNANSIYIDESILYSKNNNFTNGYAKEFKLDGGNLTIKNNYFNKKKVANYKTSNMKITLETLYSTVLGNKITIQGFLTNPDISVKGREMLITVNKKTVKTKTDVNGHFSINYTPNKLGVTNVSVTYRKTDDYDQNTIYSSFNVFKPARIIIYKIPVATKGKITKISGKLLSNNTGIKKANLTVVVEGKEYNVRTFSSGYFKVNHNVSSYDEVFVRINYFGSSVYSSAENMTTFNVKQKTKINVLTKGTIASGRTVKISGILRLGDNSGVKNQKVTVTIGSKNLEAKTYSNGYFTVNHVFDGSVAKIPIRFTFNGSTNYLASNASTTLTVVKT